uniref:E3 ubiquitin-protein ligase RNF123-like isoform X1 n=1 Tax=Styela clava TaxID=7725 RepID=UPI00193ADD95|nr:E3 ubiquitin-protein ligase RNF123-like isoform X1 [Styela clava]
MATCSSFSGTSFGKLREAKMCPPDKLNAILTKVFPKKFNTKPSGLKSNDMLGFHNLEKHITSTLLNAEEAKPEMISSSESKAGSSSGSAGTKTRSYLKGIFGEKKVDPKDSEKDKGPDFEIEHRDGRLGPRHVTFQNHPLETAPGDSFSVIGNMNFQSVKATCCVFKGKWMYEAVLGTSGLMQIGWCTATCKFTREEGVGDTIDSYAFDGYRETKWNSRDSAKYGETWSANDVVTCLLDLDNRTASFCLNGKNLGVAFRDIPIGPGIAYFPAFSVAYKEVLQINFGAHVMKHHTPGYLPIQSPPDSLGNASTLVRSLSTLINVKTEKSVLSSALDPVTECIIGAHIFKRLSPILQESYNVEMSMIPFLYELSSSPGLLTQILDWIWNFMEENSAKQCVDYLLASVIRHFKTAHIRPDFLLQKKYLNFLFGMAKHTRTKTHLLEYSFSERSDEIPYLFHIKQPPSSSNAMDNLTNRTLKERITAVEDIQRDILKAFLEVEDKDNYNCCKLFAEKFRKMAQSFVSTTREQSALCPAIVIHSFIQRLIDVVRQQWDNSTVTRANYIPASEGYLPSELFYTGMVNYSDTQRAGGLASHLVQEHRELLEKEGVSVTMGSRSAHSDSWREDHRAFLQLLDSSPGTSLSTFDDSEMESYNPVMRLARALLQQSSKLGSSSGSPSVSRKKGVGDEDQWLPTCQYLLEITDGCVMLYAQSIHQQMDKIVSTRTKYADFNKSLKETDVKLKKCNDPQFEEIKKSLEQSKVLLQKHVTEIQRSMDWLKATTYAPESQHNLWWLHQVCLKTVEKMTTKGALFSFIPEFYITGATRLFKCLREYFHPTQSIDLLPNHKQVLVKFALFLSHHHCDTRIIHTDIKTLLANTLASFVTHPLQVKAIEMMPVNEKKSLLRSMLTAYDEDKPWISMGHRILAAMWRGMGFALRYDHPPYLAKVKRLLNRDKDPYASASLLNELRDVMLDDKKLSSDFVHSIINHLNWCFSEFIGQMQEVHVQGSKASPASGGLLSALDAQSLRQVRIVDMLFEISVSLLRVLELTVTLAPEVYLDWEEWDKAEVLLNSLIRVVNQILNRVTKKQNIFDRVVASKHPGLRSVVHYPLLIALTGVLVSILKEREDPEWTKRASSALLKDPGFSKDSIDILMKDDPFALSWSRARSADEPSTSSAPDVVSVPRKMTTEGFSLRHREEVSEQEYGNVVTMVERIHKWIESAEHDEPMDEESLCTICYANEISVSFNPCGHTSCKSCISHQLMNAKECFYCKAIVESFKPIENK